MHIAGSIVSPVELVPMFCLSGHSKLRSEGKGRHILLVSEGISVQFSPLEGSPSTMGSSIASSHAYSLCGSGCCLRQVSGRPNALFFLLHDSMESPCLPTPSPGSLNNAHLPQMRPPLSRAQIPFSLSPGYLSTSLQPVIRAEVFCVLSPAGGRDCTVQHITSTAALFMQPGALFLRVSKQAAVLTTKLFAEFLVSS